MQGIMGIYAGIINLREFVRECHIWAEPWRTRNKNFPEGQKEIDNSFQMLGTAWACVWICLACLGYGKGGKLLQCSQILPFSASNSLQCDVEDPFSKKWSLSPHHWFWAHHVTCFCQWILANVKPAETWKGAYTLRPLCLEPWDHTV